MGERTDRELLEALLDTMQRIAAGIGRLEEVASRDSHASAELAALRGAANRRKAKQRSKSRDSHASPSRESHVNGDYRGKDLALPEKKEESPIPPVTRLPVTPKDRVFEFWREHLGKASTSKFDRKRQRAVDGRLRDGYTVEQLCEAIRGCKLDPFSMGQNDRHTKYDDLTLICRDAGHVDKFIAFSKAPPVANGQPAAIAQRPVSPTVQAAREAANAVYRRHKAEQEAAERELTQRRVACKA